MASSKILQLIGGGELGGAEQHVLTLSQGYDPKRFSPVFGCLIDGPLAKLTEEKGIPTLRFPMKHALDLSPLPGLVREIRRQEISLIHSHGSRANLLGRLAGRWLRLPVVSTVHSSLSQDYLSRASALVALSLDRLTLPLTAGLITVSEALAQEVANRGRRRIRTIYNGREPLAFPENEQERKEVGLAFRRQWAIPERALVLGSISRLHPAKGLQYLIQAAGLLCPDFPELHLLIMGEGPLRGDLEQQLSDTGISFTLTGFLADAHQGLPAMDIFVLPSLSEGMGLVLLEAMQAGIPLIATRTGGIPEVIRDSQDGLLVPPGDAVTLAAACKSLLENPTLARELTESGRRRWQHFSAAEMLRQTQAFYEEILRDPKA